jgi:hypothetical protein
MQVIESVAQIAIAARLTCVSDVREWLAEVEKFGASDSAPVTGELLWLVDGNVVPGDAGSFIVTDTTAS